MTSARWYGGHAAVPSVRSFSSSHEHEAVGVEEGLGLLEEQALVRRSTALGHEQQLVRVARDRFDLDLGGQVGAGVLLGVGVERRELRVPQVVVGVGAEDAAGDRLAVGTTREHELALLALHERGAGVLARGEHAAGGDARVLQQFERDEPVVRRGLGIVEDRRELREVAGPQQVRDLVHRGTREQRERFGVDLEELAGPPR